MSEKTIRRVTAARARYVLAILITLSAVAASCAATPTQESTGGYIDDSTITAKVKTDLTMDAKVSALEIHVKTYKGVVELSGFVDSQFQVVEAGNVASAVAGVRSVQNDLIVKAAVAPPNAAENRTE
ncbi:MAG TPA: BON domain-containing protein [Candidatus Binataceae bacterium]|nr:BON domain-containing protein [Candidatus Binataceae bacterium]